MTIIYVVQESPPTTQTFVWNEFEAVTARLDGAYIYPLRGASRRCGRVDERVLRLRKLLRRSLFARLIVLLGMVFHARLRVLSIMKLPPCGLKNKMRQVLALLHALIVLLHVDPRSNDGFLHAHFFGRCLDVVSYCKAVAPRLRISATGHAGDVVTPKSPERVHRLLSSADSVVCASLMLADFVSRTYGRDDALVIRCVPHVGSESTAPVASAATSKSPTPFKLLTVARLVEKKGLFDCLDAASRLVEDERAFEWFFIGDGPLFAELQHRTRHLRMTSRIRWLGPATSQDVLRAYEQIAPDLFVLPCKPAKNGDVDGIPVSLMEAMALGVPVVTTDVGGIPELVVDGLTGRVCKVGDPDDLASSIGSLMDDDAKRFEFSRAGRRHISAHFNSTHETSKMVQLFAR